jgi:hypothetical protein
MMASDIDDLLQLPDVLGILRREHGVSVSYAKLWAAGVAGIVPAYRVGGRAWRMRRSDIPQIADGLTHGAQPTRAA